MAGVEDEDEFKDALAASDAPPSAPSPTSKPRPAAAAGGGGVGLGRRLFASIPLPASLSVAIGRFSSPKPPASNAGLGLGLLLHAEPACSAEDTLASEAASAVHPPPLAPLQRQYGEDRVAGRGPGVGEEGLGLVLAEEERPTAEGRDDEGIAVDGCSANRNCFPLRGQDEGSQCPGDELGAAVDGSAAQDQEDEEVVAVEQEEATEDCAALVENLSNHSAVEQCAGHEARAVKDDNAIEVNESVMEQEGAVSILDATNGSITLESQEEDVVVAEQGEDVISVQDQHGLVEQCTADHLGKITDGNAVQDEEVVEQEGAADSYTAPEVAEQCTNNGSKSVKGGNIVEEEERVVQQEGGVGVLDAARDGDAVEVNELVMEQGAVGILYAAEDSVTVESQDEDVIVVEQGEDGISVQDQHGPVEQCTGNAVHDQELVEQEEESQEEGLLVPDQNEAGISVQGHHKLVKQCTGDQLRTARYDNAAQDQEVVGLEGATECYSSVEAVKRCTNDESRAVKYSNVVEEIENVEHWIAVGILDAAKDRVIVESQEEDLVVAEQGEAGIFVQDQHKVVEQCTIGQLRTTMDGNAAEGQEVVEQVAIVDRDATTYVIAVEDQEMEVKQGRDGTLRQDDGILVEEYNSDQLRATTEQEGGNVERVVTTYVIPVEDQEKEVEQFAADESRANRGDNIVEDNDNEKVYQVDVIDKQGIIKDGSGEESPKEDEVVVAEQGEDEFSVRDLGNVVEHAAECQEVVVQEGAIFERGVTDGITFEEPDKEVEQSAGDESRATKDNSAVEDNEEVAREGAIDKHGTTKEGNGIESQEEENMVVPDQGADDVSVPDEGTAKLVVQCTGDQLRTTTVYNAEGDSEVAEQEAAVSILSAAKVSIAVESQEVDIAGTEQVEDGVSVHDQDKWVEQCTGDQLTTIYDNAVKDQEVHRENIGLCAGYPQRPGKLNCRFYMSTGSCSYGSSCHFNHPRMKPKLEVSSFPSEQRDHEVEFLELNRVGLPIREGTRNCTYYMRYSTCRYGKKCCYNHPEQVLDAQLYTPTGWDDTHLQSSPHSKKSPEHATTGDISSGSEILPPSILRMLLPPQNVPPCTKEKEMKAKKDPDWSSASDDSDGCCSADSSDGPLCKQEHVDCPERPECPFLLKFGNCRFATSCQYYHPKDKVPIRYHPKEKFPSRYHPKKDPTQAEELTVYPDRPGKPECPFYLKTGSCKFGTNCKFHHPKGLTPSIQDSESPKRSVAANEHHEAAGTDHMYHQQKYPERPGQPDCRYYMQFGKCKFQSACIFNHPKDLLSSGWHPAECPFYMKTGTCQFGSACEFYHLKDNCPSRGGATDDGTGCEHDFVTKSEIVLQQQEQTLYPERPGEPECPHYMKHGYCKFQMRCKFHHPADRLPTK